MVIRNFRQCLLPALTLAVVLLAGSCAAASPADERIRALAAAAADGARVPDSLHDERDWLMRFYAGRGYTPAWSGAEAARAITALSLLQRAQEHGLEPADYHAEELVRELGAHGGPKDAARFDTGLSLALLRYLADLHGGRTRSGQLPHGTAMLDDFDPVAALQSALADGQLALVAEAVEPKLAIYRRLRAVLASYREMATHAQAPMPMPPAGSPAIAPGMPYAGAPGLRARLLLLGDLDTGADDGEPGFYTLALAAAVGRFQARHGLDADGKLGRHTIDAMNVPFATRVRQIELALERLRRLPALPAGPLIAINVPSYRLWAFRTTAAGAPPALAMRVIVGKAMLHQTPLFTGAMRYVEFNPYWNVPPSILRAEILPAVARDPGYLARHEMELVDARGELREPAGEADLAALRAGALRVRQRPGAQNALGTIKFGLPNAMNIYLHGTPAPRLFQSSQRDFSHGCIRVEDPAALAAFVLSDQPQWTGAAIAAAIAAGVNRTVRLNTVLPVVIFYTTAMVDSNGRALFPGDIYRLDAALDRALARRTRSLRAAASAANMPGSAPGDSNGPARQ